MPLTHLLFEVSPEVYAEFAAADVLPALRVCMEASAAGVVAQLGLPNQVQAEVRAGEALDAPLEAVVNGVRCLGLERLLWEAEAFVRRDEEESRGEVAAWWMHLLRTQQPDRINDFFAHLAGGLLEARPELLLTPALLEAVTADERQHPAVRVLVTAGISVAGGLAGLLEAEDAGAALESVFVAGGPATVEIRMPCAYVRELTSGSSFAALARIRAGFLDEVGIPFPSVVLVEDEQLPPRCYCFRLRSLSGQPRYEAADQMCDSLALYLRDRAPRLVDERVVGDLLGRLRDYPYLVKEVGARIPLWLVTAVLRALVAERYSLRDLADVLEALLDCLYTATPELQVAILGGPCPEGWVSIVQHRLQHPLAI